MKIILTFGFLIAIFAFFSCKRLDSRSEADKKTDEFVYQVSEELGQKYGMKLSGIGGAADKGIRLISVDFDRRGRPLYKDEARKIIIDCVDQFLEKINANNEIKPYLKIHPFTPKNLEINILNSDEKGYSIYDPAIGTVSSYGGIIIFNTYDPDNEYRYKNQMDESYDEAVKILNEQKNENH